MGRIATWVVLIVLIWGGAAGIAFAMVELRDDDAPKAVMGPAGPRGLQGEQGPKGDRGERGPPGQAARVPANSFGDSSSAQDTDELDARISRLENCVVQLLAAINSHSPGVGC